jgi:hypothetical protein
MIYLAATTPATNPTLMSQYGPLLAAGVALIGVLITLFITGRRDQARYRSQREDDEARYRSQREDDEARYRSQREDEYRRDQRITIADIAVSGQDFRRECGALVNRDAHWREHRDSAEAAMAGLLNKLTVAKLLVHDLILQGALDGLYTAWEAVAAAVDSVDNTLSQKLDRQEAVESLEQTLLRFDSEADALYTVALKRLKPTVVDIE